MSPCQLVPGGSANRVHQKQTGRQEERRDLLLLVCSLSCQPLPSHEASSEAPSSLQPQQRAVDKEQELRGFARSNQVNQWAGNIGGIPRDSRQGQVFRRPSCPLLSTRKQQLGTGGSPRAILRALGGGAQQAGPGPRGSHDARQRNKAPKHLLCLPNTGSLFTHHPDQTQSQNSECRRLGEGAALRIGDGTCSPRQQGSWLTSECLRPGVDQASTPMSRGIPPTPPCPLHPSVSLSMGHGLMQEESTHMYAVGVGGVLKRAW